MGKGREGKGQLPLRVNGIIATLDAGWRELFQWGCCYICFDAFRSICGCDLTHYIQLNYLIRHPPRSSRCSCGLIWLVPRRWLSCACACSSLSCASVLSLPSNVIADSPHLRVNAGAEDDRQVLFQTSATCAALEALLTDRLSLEGKWSTLEDSTRPIRENW